MKLSLYLDEDSMSRALVTALRARGLEIETVVEAGLTGESDKVQLDQAARRGKVLYTFNVVDYCRLHREYLERRAEHSGIVVEPRQRYSVKQQIRLLSKLWKAETAESMRNRLVFLRRFSGGGRRASGSWDRPRAMEPFSAGVLASAADLARDQDARCPLAARCAVPVASCGPLLAHVEAERRYRLPEWKAGVIECRILPTISPIG